ncbi:hypothetical protein WR25_10297, partial [Diploscapter pachys]
YTTLEVESVQVSVEADNSINFSSLQSIVPAAHGLYWKDNGQKRALEVDATTGKIHAPSEGWAAQPVYIYLAHGHRHSAYIGDYTKANQIFEKNISAVQQLIAAAGLTYGFKKSDKSSRTRSRSRHGVKSGFEAQPENVPLSEESDNLREHETPPKVVIEEEITEEDKPKIRGLKERIRSEKKRSEKFSIDLVKEREAHEATKAELKKVQNTLEEMKSSHDSTDNKDEEINNLHSIIEDLRSKLEELEKKKKENDGQLQEHQEYLKQSREKVAYLETQLSSDPSGRKPRSRTTSESEDAGKSQLIRSLEVKLNLANASLRACESDREKIRENHWHANERAGKLEQENANLKGIVDQLRAQVSETGNAQLLAEKDRRIQDLLDSKSKLEWRAGELGQWWNDAKWKIGELEAAVAHQRFLVETANVKIQNLNDESPRVDAPSNFTVTRPLFNSQWQLAQGQSAFPLIQSFFSTPITGSLNLPYVTAPPMSSFAPAVGVTRKTPIEIEHEFRFMINGKWQTSANYSSIPNGLGGSNNVIYVD